MKTLKKFLYVAAAFVLMGVSSAARGATNYWLPAGYSTYDLTNAANWSLGSPVSSDALWITNGPFDTSVATNTSAIVSSDVWVDMKPAVAGDFRRLYLTLGNQAWTVTNSMDVGHADPYAKARLVLSSGTLAVTNGAGTATLKVSYGTGTGSIAFAGGKLIVDHLYASNTFTGPGIGAIDFGTLVTKGNSVMSTNAGTTTLYLGTYAGLRGEIDILGGTNLIDFKTLNIGHANLYGGSAAMATGVVQVLGAGTVLQGNQLTNLQITVGANSASIGQLVVSNGARANVGQVTFGTGNSSNGVVLVSGTNSVLLVNGQIYLANSAGAWNVVRVENGGRLQLQNTQVYISSSGGQNNWMVADGGMITNISDLYIGGAQALGGNGTGFMAISNAGVIQVNSSVFVGGKAGSYGEARISGPGSLLQVGYNGFMVGSNSSNLGWNNSPALVVITDGGTLEPGAKMIAGLLGAITNVGGFFQFTAASPTVSNQVAGTIVLTNGALSFRAINNAPLAIAGNLTNITYQGSIGFQLNSATNAAGLAAYTFDSGAVPTNYQRLILTGNNPFWRSAALTIGSGGELIATNSTGASIGAVLTNAGTVRVVNSVLTYMSNVVQNGGNFITSGGTNQFNRGLTLAGNSTLTFTNSASRVAGVISNNAGSTIQALNTTVTFQDGVTIGGLYYSDPSTNIFNTNVTVTASGALYGSNGDLFVFNRDLAMQSTNRSQYDLSAAMVLFTNGSGATGHVFDLTGSGALDKGSNWITVADLATNFSIGTLSLADGNTLSVTGGAANALYVGTLDLQGLLSTNDLASRLWLGINVYYDQAAAGNAYLGAKVYDLPGAGLLIPIPEPTSLALGGLALVVLALRRRRLG